MNTIISHTFGGFTSLVLLMFGMEFQKFSTTGLGFWRGFIFLEEYNHRETWVFKRNFLEIRGNFLFYIDTKS